MSCARVKLKGGSFNSRK